MRWVRAVDDQSTLGYATALPFRWWPRPKRSRIAIFETPDESLLFTVRPSGWLGMIRIVADADGQAIAVLSDRTISMPTRCFQADHDIRSGVITELGGGVAAHWRPERVGTFLEFGEELRHEPLVKMALLGAILNLD